MTHTSLFSGIGGFDLAAEWAGFDNSFNCEIDPFCSQILNYYFPNATQYGDIKTTDFTTWRGKIDILTGGFPCQPFSLAGQRKGTDDDRYLWPEMLRAISDIRPTWVIGENVGGIVSMVQPGCEVEVATEATLFGEDYYTTEERQEFIIERICQDIEHLGYSIQPILIPACGVGAPHRRDRVWFVAHRDGLVGDTWRAESAGQFGQAGIADGGDNAAENPQRVRRDSDQSEEAPRAGRFGQPGAGDHVRLCREAGITADGSDAGVETVRGGQNGVLSAGTTADADRFGGREVHDPIQPREPNGARSDGNGREWTVADPESIGSSITGRTRNGRSGFENSGCGGGLDQWQNFPTQSPVCRGDDGLSDRMDIEAVYAGIGAKRRLTARPFPRWREASIKGFGNAVVPIVPFQIMEAIKEIERAGL